VVEEEEVKVCEGNCILLECLEESLKEFGLWD